ncbi:MAG: DUF456 domain-containing protein [Planctomycetota bacterium]
MEWVFIILVGLIFALVGVVCVISVVVSLPGAWVMIGLALVIELMDFIYLPVDAGQTFGWWTLGIAVALAAFGELLEFSAGALGAKTAGSSSRGMWGALGGGIIGAILGTFIPVPLLGTLIGAVVGTFTGALLGEMSHKDGTLDGSIKPAIGATIGRILGTLAKVPVATAIWMMLTIAAFWP